MRREGKKCSQKKYIRPEETETEREAISGRSERNRDSELCGGKVKSRYGFYGTDFQTEHEKVILKGMKFEWILTKKSGYDTIKS